MNEKLKIKDELIIMFASIVVSLLYMLLSLVEYTFTYPFDDPTYHPILITEGFAFMILFLGFPAILLSFYIIPSLIKRVKLKRFFQYLYIFSWIFVFIFWHIAGIIHNIKTQ